MNLIRKFSEWVNESVTPEQKNKVFDEAEKWAKDLGLDVTSNLEGGWFMVRLMGTWTLSLEASTKKSGQDSMHRQTYSRDYDNLKWYIEYPAVFSQYNSRGNKKPGNFKTFKTLIEKFQKIYENLLYVEKFLETLGVDKKISGGRNGTVRFEGNNLKELGLNYLIGGGELAYRFDKYTTKDFIYDCRFVKATTNGVNMFTRESFNPEKGEIFYYAALAAKRPIESAGKVDTDRIIEILEILKDRPREEVWKMIEKGDWKSLADRFRGKLSGTKFGL
jgi:hypothetical protein